VTHFRSNGEFGPTLKAAAERLGISPTAVEKDYWVTQVLRVLVAKFPDDFVFKGGTSLSKAYRIVERFSEDIDVLVLPGSRGRGSVDKLMKAMGAQAAQGVSGEAISAGSETGRHRAYSIRYPATQSPTDLITTSVLLEMGVRGGPHPHEAVLINSLLGNAFSNAGQELEEFEDLAPFEVPTLHPARTLLEKLFLLHRLELQLSADVSLRPPAGSGRHFYDIFQLLGDDRVLSLLDDRAHVMEVITSIENVTQRFFGSYAGVAARPSEGFAACAMFHPTASESVRLRESYESTMPELYFGRTPLPSWETICERVTDHAALL
jgi:hypothetical protein